MRGFLSGKRFQYACLASLLAGSVHPFVATGMRAMQGKEVFSLSNVAENFWPESAAFFVVFLLLNVAAAMEGHRRDMRNEKP